VIIIRKQTHQRVRTVAHSQKLPTRVRSCRSRHASRCIPSTSMRRVDSGVTPARRRRRRPDPPLKLHLRVSFLFFCRYVGSRGTCSRSCDDSCATKRRWRTSPRRRRRQCASRRPSRLPRYLQKPSAPVAVSGTEGTPTTGCGAFTDRWT
jgi:hypothetical protein